MGTQDTGSIPLDSSAKRRITFNNEINVTHIVNFAMGLIAACGVYFSLDKRVSRQEEMAPVIAKMRDEKDARTDAQLSNISGDVKQLTVSVDKLGRAFEIQNAVTTQAAKERAK